MAGYTPMPMNLEQQLQSIVREISAPQASASNTVFIIREALGQAYAAGHRDGHTLAQSLDWITKDLAEAYEARKAALKAAAETTNETGTTD
jgi:hypothetical protein